MNPTTSTTSMNASPSASSAAPLASAAPTAAPGPSAAAAPPVAMKDPIATAFAADLKAIGLDAKKLPPIATLAKTDKKKLRQVMDLFTKATGMKCGDCHEGEDYAKSTPKKNIASHMWDAFVRDLVLADGSPIFCDSCHQARPKVLDRSDKKALGKWMQSAFVDKLARRDKKDHACTTCHGSDMDMDILATWAKK